ncbi:MAG TPA: glycosyltransferase 87 family protein [Candidatus Lustribacter sp.]|nr:glycosyltransferase 87 family protein [Candidatus Lustribacter sp.]
MWRVERTLDGVDATRDELLPFVGPAASLPLWSLLARLPFDGARAVWLSLLVLALFALAAATAALATGRLTGTSGLSALLFAALTGPLVSAIGLGQAALLSAAAVAAALVAFERRSPWALGAAFVAAIQPNLALPLAVRFTGRFSALMLGGAAALFVALTLIAGDGLAGARAYVQRLAEHGAGERFIVIQYGVPAILASLHVSVQTATIAGNACALIALAGATAFAWRFRAQPLYTAAFAIAVLPWALPFFHEHDFVIEVIPAIALAAVPDARVRTLAGVATLCVLVNWLNVAQRPDTAAQTVALAFALAFAFAVLPHRTPREPSALPPVIAAALLAAIAVPLALAFPAPVWPDALGAFHAAPGLDSSAVWAAEQQAAGLGAAVPAWGLLRAIPLFGALLLAVGAYVATTTRPERTASGTAASDSP